MLEKMSDKIMPVFWFSNWIAFWAVFSLSIQIQGSWIQFQHQDFGIQNPKTRFKEPSSGLRISMFQNLNPSSMIRDPGSMIQVPGSGMQVLSSRI